MHLVVWCRPTSICISHEYWELWQEYYQRISTICIYIIVQVGYDKFLKDNWNMLAYHNICIYLFAQPVENNTWDSAFTLQYCVKKWIKHNWQTRENFLLDIGDTAEIWWISNSYLTKKYFYMCSWYHIYVIAVMASCIMPKYAISQCVEVNVLAIIGLPFTVAKARLTDTLNSVVEASIAKSTAVASFNVVMLCLM